MNDTLYDTVILGGGPAGVAAAVYAARKKIKTLLITKEFGGQSVVASEIENWIGEEEISGFELAMKLEKHVKKYKEDVDIKTPETVTKIEKVACEDEARVCDFVVTTESGDTYRAKSVIYALGGRRRKLGIPGEDRLEGTGVSYCATCDAPLFSDKKVVVVGGGNAGAEAAVDLLPYAEKVTILQNKDQLTADTATVDRINSEEKIEVITNASAQEITGSQTVEGVVYKDENGEEKTIEAGGVFVEIGSIPNSELVEDMVETDDHGQIKIDPRHGSTSQPGLYAAGDVTDDPYKQNNTAAGDAVKAALAAYSYVQNLPKRSPAEEPEE
ncbi:MAG: FAD-dependent oxidoreductase [Candidatus Campbellbacteria bacterium]|nr:FAD-dependent oxidoreductase [Candidatus Campbellbacteria bacterium]